MLLADKIKENKQDFIVKVNSVAAALGIDVNWLMAVMWFESKLNPRAANPFSSAVGLIQFLSSTAKSLGTSREALLQMSNVNQLDYVYKYLRPYKGKMKSAADVYMAVFSPANITSNGNKILLSNPKWVAANKIFNSNNDSKVTVGEVRTFFNNYYRNLAPFGVSALSLLIGLGLVLTLK